MHFYEVASAITELHSYFSLLVKAVTKVYLGLRGEVHISPLDEEQRQSHSERRASWAKCACEAIFGKHHEPYPFRSIL